MKWIRCLTSQMVSSMTVEERGKLLTGIVCLMENIPFDGEKLSGSAAFAFAMMSSEKEKEESKAAKCAEAGRKGGGNPALQRNKPAKAAKRETPITSKPKHERFIPPTLEEVVAYCSERGNDIDPEYFLDYYTTNGWKQSSGNPVKDWKSCVRTWEHNDRERKRSAPQKKEYGPNGVQIKPEPERLHDLDDIFGIGG